MSENSSPADAAATTASGRRRRGALLFLRDLLVIFVAAVLISVVIKTFLVRSFYIPSSSMEDTLQIYDRIIVNQLVPDVVELNRGDIIVFQDPGGWLAPSPQEERSPVVEAVDWVLAAVGLSAPDSNDHLIKRVIGLPGDEVACCNTFGQMSVNGVPLDEPYLKLPERVTKVAKDDFAVTVPDDALWVMGDNRYNSCDSRCNASGPSKGFVPLENVVGRAVVISWPTDRWVWLDNHPEVFEGVDDSESAG
ncbi:signal peptidase I [Salinibacterium sp. dk2585]|uniref:signal peptidase I n=1 Tax=unclassified Salinibacterium TaxID=2632331 RepID=UPI0011C24AD6|nr:MULTISPECIES: signal peptidase I [unclassified Salinibacterium]QEE61609.1 signal peptidase I [Salinibacterium sp. dk2585]TXK52306.1 signal peptidase I [Salinibacterium sp. dk5596]